MTSTALVRMPTTGMSSERALELLRAGADVHARGSVTRGMAYAPSPLEIAQQLVRARAVGGDASDTDAGDELPPHDVQLVVGASRPRRKPGSRPDLKHDQRLHAAHLVIEASKPWTPRNAHLFPASTRSTAAVVGFAGLLVARQYGGREAHALWELWAELIVPACLDSNSRDALATSRISTSPMASPAMAACHACAPGPG